MMAKINENDVDEKLLNSDNYIQNDLTDEDVKKTNIPVEVVQEKEDVEEPPKTKKRCSILISAFQWIKRKYASHAQAYAKNGRKAGTLSYIFKTMDDILTFHKYEIPFWHKGK